MIIPTNPSNLGTANQRLVLGSIFQYQPVSKAELARILKLSKPSIADNVNKLIEAGIVKELGEDEASKAVGRKPVMLSIDKNYRYIIVIDFYYEKTVFSMLNLREELINEIIITQTPHQDYYSWMNMSVTAVKTLLSSRSIEPNQLAAIGISSPGVINDYNQILVSSMYGAFDSKSLRKKLIEQFSCPIYLKNATNASALGEAFVGQGKKYKNIIYISCGVGFGAGIIINGRLHEGTQSGAGEIANFISPENLDDSQTLEERIGIKSLVGKIRTHSPAETKALIGNKGISLGLIAQLIDKKDPFILSCIEEIGTNIGAVICNLVMMLNPDLVIFGGEYKIFSPTLLPQIQKMIDRYCIIPTKIIPSSLGERVTSLGMSVFCRELFFNSICGVNR